MNISANVKIAVIGLVHACILNVSAPAAINSFLSDAIRLTYRLPEQSVFHFEAISTLKQNMVMSGRNVKTDTKTNLGLSLTVRETVLSQSTIDIEFNKATITVAVVGVESKQPAQEMEIQNISGKSSTITISPNGTIVDGTYDASDSGFVELTTVLRTTRALSRLFPLLPTSDVVPGSTWTQELMDTTPAANGLGYIITNGTIVLSYRGTFDTLGMHCWIIDFHGDELVQKGSYDTGNISMILSGQGAIQGTSLHNANTGVLIASESTLHSKASMNFTGQMNTAVPVESEVSLSIKQHFEALR